MSSILGLGGEKQLVSLLPINGTEDILEFEATESEQHEQESIITDHPLEEGADTSDHVRSTPDRLTLNVIVSNFPVLFLASFRADGIQGGDPATRAEDAFEYLERLRRDARLLIVSTTLKTYENLILTGISVTRDKDTSRVLRAQLSFRTLRFSQTQSVDAPVNQPEPVQPARRNLSNKGRQQKVATPEAAAAGNSTSLLGGILGL